MLSRRSLLFFGVAAAVAGLALVKARAPAATADYNVTAAPGVTMQVASPLSFTVSLNPSAGDLVNLLHLRLPDGYTISGAAAPVGWTVQRIENTPSVIVEYATSCASAYPLSPTGAAQTFGVTVTPGAAPADVTTDSLQPSTRLTKCNNGQLSDPSPFPSWTRYSLGVQTTVTPPSVGAGGSVTLNTIVTNYASAAVTAARPVTTGGAPVTAPTPATANLALGGSAAFTSTAVLTTGGTYLFTTCATDQVPAGASCPTPVDGVTHTALPATSNPASAGSLTIEATLSTTAVVSGSDVTVVVTVRNNGTAALSSVNAQVDLGAGMTAGASPNGRNIGFGSLAPGESKTDTTALFTITGSAGTTFWFTAIAHAGGTDSNPATTPRGTIAQFTVAVTPTAVAKVDPSSCSNSPDACPAGCGATCRTLSFTVSNPPDSGVWIKSVSVVNGSPANWIEPGTMNVPAGWAASGPTNPDPHAFTWNAACASSVKPGETSPAFTLGFAGIADLGDSYLSNFAMNVSAVQPTSCGKVGVEGHTLIVRTGKQLPDVTMFTLAATAARVRAHWNNTSAGQTLHDGVTIVRSPTTPVRPAHFTRYSVGQVISGSDTVVVYTDTYGSTATGGDDGASPAAGTVYTYKVYNHDADHVYAPGTAIPDPNGLKAQRLPAGGPLWVYTPGVAQLSQPMYRSNIGAYAAGSGFSPAPAALAVSLAGDELFRPVPVVGNQSTGGLSRPMIQTIGGAPHVYAADLNGYIYRASADTGALEWVGNGAAALNPGSFHAAPNIAPTAYLPGLSTDLMLIGSGMSSLLTNKVYALDARTGARVATSAASFGEILGQGYVDVSRSVMYVNSYPAAGVNLRALNLPDLTTAWELGVPCGGGAANLEGPTYSDYAGTTLYVGEGRGNRIFAVNHTAGAPTCPGSVRALDVGASMNGFVVANRTIYYASAGGVFAKSDPGTGTALTALWSRTDLGGGSTPVLIAGRLFVGASSGHLYMLDSATGATVADYDAAGFCQAGNVTNAGVPNSDYYGGQVFVGTLNGCLVAFPATF